MNVKEKMNEMDKEMLSIVSNIVEELKKVSELDKEKNILALKEDMRSVHGCDGDCENCTEERAQELHMNTNLKLTPEEREQKMLERIKEGTVALELGDVVEGAMTLKFAMERTLEEYKEHIVEDMPVEEAFNNLAQNLAMKNFERNMQKGMSPIPGMTVIRVDKGTDIGAMLDSIFSDKEGKGKH